MSAASNDVRFRDGTFRAGRPKVLPFLKDVVVAHWGWLVRFHGSERELIELELATVEMFDIGKSTQRSYDNGFGDKTTVYRVRKQWDVEMYVSEESAGGFPTEKHPAGTNNWWRKHGGEAERATLAILARFARDAAARS